MVVPALKRRGRRVALLAWYPPDNPALPPFIPNMGLYMVAAALQAVSDVELRIWDERERSPDDVAQEVMAFDPDIVAGSAFLWSLPQVMDVIAALARDDPTKVIVLGGPSARINMLSHPPFRDRAPLIDVLVEGEGEAAFAALVDDTGRNADTWQAIPGLRIRTPKGWVPTGLREGAMLDDLASPYQQGLIPHGGIGLMETYRGCPFTCSFCEWGVMDAPKNVLSADRIAQEFRALETYGLKALLMADAGLNLNATAFANLERAALETGFLADRALICEVYPSAIRPRHIEFLSKVGAPHIGVGLQSFDEAVLQKVERRFDVARFGGLLSALQSVASVTVEIIMGLPGDSPERFLANFERARALGTGLRVYHCAVLPSALMARASKDDALDYDPVTLKLRSCQGWAAQAVDRMAHLLTQEARKSGGASGDYFWVFPPG